MQQKTAKLQRFQNKVRKQLRQSAFQWGQMAR